MTIDLSKDLEQFVHDAVRAGLYAREDDVIRDALTRLKQALPGAAQPPSGPTILTEEELADQALQRRLFEAGLLSEIKPPRRLAVGDDRFTPVPIEGEPLSETVIRERRVTVAVYVLDTSAVVKRYVLETGTAWIRAIAAPAAGHVLYIARITDVEVTAAIARRRSGASLTPAQALAALNQFRQDFAQDYRIAEIGIPLLQQASQLAAAHALRAYDAVQLAAALEIRMHVPPLVLVSADRDLNAAAAASGLAVDDPNAHP